MNVNTASNALGTLQETVLTSLGSAYVSAGLVLEHLRSALVFEAMHHASRDHPDAAWESDVEFAAARLWNAIFDARREAAELCGMLVGRVQTERQRADGAGL